MTDRIQPTPEDMAIFERNLKRFMRWHRENMPANRDKAAALHILHTTRRFCADFTSDGTAKR